MFYKNWECGLSYVDAVFFNQLKQRCHLNFNLEPFMGGITMYVYYVARSIPETVGMCPQAIDSVVVYCGLFQQ